MVGHGDAVEVAHGALNDGEIRPLSHLMEERPGGLRGEEEEIQVGGLGAQDLLVEHGVDVVRPRLAGGELKPPALHGAQHGAGQGGLSRARGRGAK